MATKEGGKAMDDKKHNEKYLDLHFEVKALPEDDDEDEQFGFFEGKASTFGDMDLVDDIIEQGAFENTIQQKQTFPLLWQHNISQPIGKIVKAEETKEGLEVKGRINKGTQLGRDAFALLKAGDLDRMSIGFRVIDQERKRGGVRKIKELELFEISLVTFPANDKARITQVKAVTPYQDLPLAAKGRDWDAENAVKRVREHLNSKEAPSGDYKKAFLWSGEDEEKGLSSYKLPIADVVEGELRAIPRGIFAAAAAVEDFKMSKQAKERVRSHLTRYYAKMREEFEDKSLEAPWESDDKQIDSAKSLKELEQILRDRDFTQSEAKAMVSKMKSLTSQRDVDGEGSQRDVDATAQSIINDIKSKFT